MNLNLSGSTQSHMNTANTAIQSTTAAQTAVNTSKTADVNGTTYTTGQVFSGEVAEINGKDILLLLGNHQTMSARLEGDINLILGQNVYFEVKSNSSNQISLRPLYTNLTGTDPSVLKALDAAGLPVNDRTVAMTSSMMEEGMPINKNALQSMFRQVNGNQEVSPQTIVQMTKLSLPITEMNVTQFENYKNMEHQLTGDINLLSEGLPELADKLFTEGNAGEAVRFSTELLEMLTDASKEQVSNETDSEQSKDTNINLKADTTVIQDNAGEAKAGSMTNALQNLTPEQRDSLAGQLEKLGVKPEISAQIKTGDLSNEQLLSLLKDTLTLQDQDEGIQKLLQGGEYKSLLKNVLSEQLLIKPEDVSKEGRVEELYERMAEQSRKLTQILQNVNKSAPELAKSASNMNDNLNFMNQMNHMLTYVQLPLKMARENANGDLYVYTNKKNLQNHDGNVSALLHLEMEHLGTMDIHVAMQQNKVSTHFYMQKEEMLDFIEANIHILNERLTKKGYSMTTKVTMKEQEEQGKSIVDEFLKKGGEAPAHTGAPMKFSFDVRA